jgi:3-methylcrotonyl-CoA carboxylase alpha subunit
VDSVGVSFREGGVRVDMRGTAHDVFGHLRRDGKLMASIDETKVNARVRTLGNATHLFLDGLRYVFEWIDPYLPIDAAADRHGGLNAPMPGRIIAILTKDGATVARGAPLIVMEAMKMEHTVTAPSAGVIEKVLCSIGDQVKEGVELLRLA